jgi:hypothetical protein
MDGVDMGFLVPLSIVVVVFVVWLLVVRWPCSWVALEIVVGWEAFLVVFLVGKWCLSLGGG